MSLNDPISDFLTRIRNAVQARKETVDVRASNIVGKILEIFKADRYVEDFRLMKTDAQGSYKVYLRYNGKKPAIIGIQRVSKPGIRIYKERDNLPKVLNGLGTAVISTSKGILTDKEARKANVGGEVICVIW